MKTQFIFDQLISICHVLMQQENRHFTLSHSSCNGSSELTIYFDFDEDGVINALSDWINMNFLSLQTTLIVFKDKDPFKILKVQVK